MNQINRKWWDRQEAAKERGSRKWTFNNNMATTTKREKKFTKQTESNSGKWIMTMKGNSSNKHKHQG